MNSRFARTLLLAAVVTLGCEPAQQDGPPSVRYGQDECIHCGMILSEERHTAAIVHDVAGRRESLLFDDIGDLIDYERENPNLSIHRRYVHDLDTKQWLDVTTASVVHASGLHTPMGSGLAAFATRESADSAAKRLGGEVISWQAAIALRAKRAERTDSGSAGQGGEDPKAACCSGGQHDSQSASSTADR